ncbi:unnamed protein product [Polarella glacialis]|uniref:SHOCT domain-containing protein n=1 Tax=Polarella glacialis TaxID=89957 RepID=A0A813JPC7_POLGL|nr:unnamed protein product [Polarella glacialis]|mmetsp:Transcript_3061/g.4774  ORF Transcript_3061/g.4774 Transcript_3061/m.4774 type:complete len:314 (-) Transcript_3061:392-1333(-)|eukprot:CAMPEP_0115070096 /NCGR_PEP_ID=MMETSP0227-20121206/12924_1 /TAXON_ID=89957 /ORGANISM="Polarella glacialis, Strain CCMP 1383" /LENGTH=313 /DNA_ID=CAMNT_0002456573 /DNA_START=102 /DNA_END=1043 /DNA_ORIENTATION=+
MAFVVQTAAGVYGAETTAEDVGHKVDALDTVASVAALIFGFGVSISYDVIKDGVASEWGDEVEAIFISLGVVVVCGSLLPSLVIPFRAYYIRQLLGNGGDKAVESAKHFQASTIYMAAPCMLGLVISGFALVIQLGLMLLKTSKSSVLVPSACIGGPLAALTFWWILRLMYHANDILLPHAVPYEVQGPYEQLQPLCEGNVYEPLSENSGTETGVQYVELAAPEMQYLPGVPEGNMLDWALDIIRAQLKEVEGLHKDGVLSHEELAMAKSTVVVQSLGGGNILSLLKQLQELHKSGDLSQEEFTMAKTKVMQR